MSRKLLKVLLILVVVMTALVGLTGPQRVRAASELTFVYWNTGPEAGPGWEKTIAEFLKENPDVTVKLLPVDGANWGAYLDGVATLIAGGEKPDLMWVATEGVRLLVSLDLATPLDDFIAADKDELKEYLADVTPAMLDSFKIDGKQYQLPYSWNDMVMYYNTARLKEAGLTAPTADWTRADFLKMAQALTVEKDGKTVKYGFAWDNGGLFTSAIPWIFANGGSIVTDNFCAPNVTDPKVIEALQFMHDLIYKYKVSPAPTGYGDIFNMFRNGDIAMFGAGRWPLTNLIPAKFADFDIQLWPGNPKRTTEFGIDGFPILKTSKDPKAAWKLVKYMTRAEVQNAMVGSVDAPVSNIPARRSVANAMTKFPPKNSAILYGALEGAAQLVPAPPKFNQMENIFLRYTGLIFANEMSVEDAMKAAQTELVDVVSCKK